MTKTYMKTPERKAQISQVACQLAAETHYTKVRRHHVAERCGTAPANISRVVGSMNELREVIARQALHEMNNTVLAQLITDRHPSVVDLNTDTKQRILMESVA